MKRLPLLAILIAQLCMAGLAGARGAPLACVPATPDCLLDEAAAMGEIVTGAAARDEVQFAIATALGRLGRTDEALEIAAAIGSPRTLADAQGEIAIAAAQAGKFDKAYAIAVAINDARDKSARIAAFETLAAEQAAEGQIDAAFDTLAAITNPYRRSEAQAVVASSAARAGNIAGAMRAASQIGTNYWFAPNLHELQIASGVVARAEGFDHFWFYEALVSIAQIQAGSGDVLGALQTARS
ncbi:MAG: hypothetical protein KIS86_19005, partial [Devosia sp.]|nr:hypothetical protein [Devosia sp.]